VSSSPDLFRNADLALYAAKDRGRGVVVTYHNDLHVKMLERVTRTCDLRRALDEGQLHLLYQPIVSIETGEVMGVEALARWLHPQRGPVAPREFITVAEQSGLILELGRWVLSEACRQAQAWRVIAPDIRLSVNASGRQVQRRDFVDEVAAVVDQYDIPPGGLAVELTESVLMHEGLGTPGKLAALHDLGALVAIDDFGVGYSSLGYLQRFPIDILKIDKSFVDNLGADGGRAGALARAVISMAHALGMEAIAEGVELPAQRDELWSLGCPLAQGYLYARPLPPEAITATLVQHTCLGPSAPRVGHRSLQPPGPRRPPSVIQDPV